MRQATLADLCSLVTDGTHDTPKPQSEGYPLIKGKDIAGGVIDFTRCDYISRADHERVIARSKTEFGDTLFSNIGSIGDTAYVNTTREFSIKNVALFKPNPQVILGRYLYYVVAGPRFHSIVTSARTGSAQPFLSLKQLRQQVIQYHEILAEQQRVVQILCAYDDLIENNTRRIQILEEMAAVIYREWFVEYRFPGHESVPMVDSELGPIPEGWSVVPLNSVCRRITDGSHRSPPSVDQGFAMASVKDMTPRSIYIAGCRKISLDDFEDLSRQDCKPLPGDVLIAKDGSYLKHVFSIEEECDVVILSSIALLRPNELINSHVLTMYLRQPETRARLATYVSGVAIPRIVLKDFRRFPVILAPSSIQESFVRIVHPVLKLALKLEQSSEVLRQTRDLLLPRLISGEIDVSHLDIHDAEPAA